jgi:hypothetical protein
MAGRGREWKRGCSMSAPPFRVPVLRALARRVPVRRERAPCRAVGSHDTAAAGEFRGAHSQVRCRSSQFAAGGVAPVNGWTPDMQCIVHQPVTARLDCGPRGEAPRECRPCRRRSSRWSDAARGGSPQSERWSRRPPKCAQAASGLPGLAAEAAVVRSLTGRAASSLAPGAVRRSDVRGLGPACAELPYGARVQNGSRRSGWDRRSAPSGGSAPVARRSVSPRGWTRFTRPVTSDDTSRQRV